MRWQAESSSFNIRFIAAKPRVAPLELLTVPCLELQGAVLATRLNQSIIEETHMQFMKDLFFTDSNIVLSWIHSQAREFKPFVSARVAEIQGNSDPSQWRHLPGEFNVADDVSRGIPVERLTDRWKHGPEFLGLPEDDWPNDEFTANQSEVEKEGHKPQLVMKLTNQPELIDCKTFSNWRLVRVSAYVLRFISNLPIYAIGKEQDSRKFQRSKPWTAQAPRTSGNRDVLGQEEVLDPQSPRYSQNCKVPMCTLPRNGTQGWKLSLWLIYQEVA